MMYMTAWIMSEVVASMRMHPPEHLVFVFFTLVFISNKFSSKSFLDLQNRTVYWCTVVQLSIIQVSLFSTYSKKPFFDLLIAKTMFFMLCGRVINRTILALSHYQEGVLAVNTFVSFTNTNEIRPCQIHKDAILCRWICWGGKNAWVLIHRLETW